MSLKVNLRSFLMLSLVLAMALAGLGWFQASPAAAQEPSGDNGLVVLVIPSEGEPSVAGVGTPPVFNVGDVFKVAVVAQGIAEPGIFGSQFEVSYKTGYLQAVNGSLEPGADLLPVVNPVKFINPETGLISFAASRQGDLANVAGNVVLATFDFEAVGATEPPEGQTTTIDLQNVKLGAKGGIEVPISATTDLDVIIREGPPPPDDNGDIFGLVKVEARADDNQAGHEVTAAGSTTLATTTEISGSFRFVDAPADTYDMTANSAGFLKATCPGVVHATDAPTSLLPVTLLAGDIDDSGAIDIADASAIGMVFGSTDPQVADLNDDGVVDILDLILMAANFDQDSASNPWVCQ